MNTAPGVTSLDGFRTTVSIRPRRRSADELARALFDAVNGDDVQHVDEIPARSLLSCDVRGTRSRTGQSPIARRRQPSGHIQARA